MNTFANLVDALTALPVGPEAIADHLADLGVVAQCNEPGKCAIAEYVTAVVAVPAGYVVRVSEFAASIRRPASVDALERAWFGDMSPVTEAAISRPDIQQFIENFDRGQYPALVDGALVKAAA